MATSFTTAQLERFRREAKKLGRQQSITHSEALDRIAAEQGYKNWSLLAKHSEPPAASPASQPATRTEIIPDDVSLERYGIDALNAMSMPPDMRAMLVPQLKVLRWAPGQYAYRFEVDDESQWGSDRATFDTLGQVLRAAAENSGRLSLADIVLNGMPVGNWKMDSLRQSAEQVAADIAIRHPDQA